MSFEALAPYLKERWLTIRAQLLDGSYKPQPVDTLGIDVPAQLFARAHEVIE